MVKVIALHVFAGVDRNGNGKRGWILIDSDGFEFDFVRDHGSGFGQVLVQYPSAVGTSTMVGINAAEWRYQNSRNKHRKKGEANAMPRLS